MYCMKCGVRMADGSDRCPLCGTENRLPDKDRLPDKKEKFRTYPERYPENTPSGYVPLAAFLTAFCLITCTVVMMICVRLYGAAAWGGYAALGIATVYMIAVFPLWFPRRDPLIFMPVAHLAVGGYLLYICLKTGGHWFLSFAFPLTGISCLVLTALSALLFRIRDKRLYIAGGTFLIMGGFSILVEFFEHITFGTVMFRWSLFAAGMSGAFGIFLILAAIVPRLSEFLKRHFFI